MEPEVATGRELAIASPAGWLGEAVVVDDTPLWMAWEGARQAWLDSKRRRSKGKNTVKTYDIAAKQFFAWAAVPPWQASAGLAQGWAQALGEQGLSESTVALKLASLSSFYDFVQRRYSFRTPDGRDVTLWPADQRNPFDAVERPKISPYGRAKYPSPEEAQRMLARINTECLTGKRDFALLFMILVTCRRSSEVLNLRWGDIREGEDGNYVFRYRYKGGSMRRGVLPRMCYQAICAYLTADGRPPGEMGAEDYVFVAMDPERIERIRQGGHPQGDAPTEGPRPLSNSMANRILKKYARRAGVDLEKAHIHGLRHAGARLRAQQMKKSGRGVDYAEIMELLGHSSLAVTQIYSTTILEDPEDPGGEAAARALLPKGRRRKGQGSQETEEQGRLL